MLEILLAETNDFVQSSHSLRQIDDEFQTDFFYSQLAVACIFSPFSFILICKRVSKKKLLF